MRRAKLVFWPLLVSSSSPRDEKNSVNTYARLEAFFWESVEAGNLLGVFVSKAVEPDRVVCSRTTLLPGCHSASSMPSEVQLDTSGSQHRTFEQGNTRVLCAFEQKTTKTVCSMGCLLTQRFSLTCTG